MRTWFLMFLIACGGTSADVPDDAGPDVLVDAPTDGMVMPPPVPGRELATAAGRLTGGAFVVDVQLGAAIEQAPAQNGTTTLTTGSPIQP